MNSMVLEPPWRIMESLEEAELEHRWGRYGARERVLRLCRDLIAALEYPIESIQRMWWAEPARNADCRIAVGLGLFEQMLRGEQAVGQGREFTTGELAGLAAAAIDYPVHPAMISRIMRHLAAMNVVGASGRDAFFLLPFSRALADPANRSGVIINHDLIGPAIANLPSYLQDTECRYPFDSNHQPFHAAHRTQLSMYQWCQQNSKYGRALRSYTHALSVATTAFPDSNLYPVFERLIQPFNYAISDTLLVGIGHVGHVLRKVNESFPDHPGRLILENIDPSFQYPEDQGNPFEVIRHGIFAPQPIRGAKAYYCSALRGRDEADCVRILEQLRTAMIPGYSILLVDEHALPAQNATWEVTSVEQVESGANAVMVPTELELWDIIRQAGFTVKDSYRPAFGTMVLIEGEPNPIGMDFAQFEPGPYSGF